MPEEVRLWQVESDDVLREYTRTPLDLESRLEDWLANDISILADNLLVIGRQVETDFSGYIDLLCIDEVGDLVIIELKRDRTPREVTAQALDYASWVEGLSSQRITEMADQYLKSQGKFEEAFKNRFDHELPDSLNGDHRILIVASRIDPSSERIIRYLSEKHGVNINAATFHYFRSPDEKELLARIFLIEPEEVEYQTRTRSTSKRRPNLTYEQLQDIAQHNEVSELYTHFVLRLESQPSLHKSTTRSSIVFQGSYKGTRRAIFSLIPTDSNPGDGLRFQIYSLRIAKLFEMPEEHITSILPERKEPWEYYSGAGPDDSGYAGFFRTAEEIDRFLTGLRGSDEK